jgi:hypothetical protein
MPLCQMPFPGAAAATGWTNGKRAGPLVWIARGASSIANCAWRLAWSSFPVLSPIRSKRCFPQGEPMPFPIVAGIDANFLLRYPTGDVKLVLRQSVPRDEAFPTGATTVVAVAPADRRQSRRQRSGPLGTDPGVQFAPNAPGHFASLGPATAPRGGVEFVPNGHVYLAL